jgi:hypothetical protein
MLGAQISCRACGGVFGPTFCDLGVMAVANSYPAPDANLMAEPRFALRAKVCADCRLVQLDHIVDPALIFSDYAYFSSVSSSFCDHAARYCQQMIARLALDRGSFVVEIASNDGYLLRNFVAAGVPCLGVEPAANVAARAQAIGVPTKIGFWGRDTAAAVVRDYGKADLLIANNVLAHVPDINGFVAGLACALADDGVLTIEAPQLLAMVAQGQFDTIYHEHYSYWSLLALEPVLARHGLWVFDLDHLPTHGGSLRVFASKIKRDPTAAVLSQRHDEAAKGLAQDAFYAGFQDQTTTVLAGFRDWLAAQKTKGRKIAAYGAAAKGNTFLNAAGVGAGDLACVADLAPAKQGRLLPGSYLPVVTPDALLAQDPDDIVILPWNIAPEIVTQLRSAGFAGGLWTAVPQMRSW